MKRSALSAVALAALLVAMPLGRSQLGLPFGTSLAQAQEVNVNFSIFLAIKTFGAQTWTRRGHLTRTGTGSTSLPVAGTLNPMSHLPGRLTIMAGGSGKQT
jgi:hypothetical protein